MRDQAVVEDLTRGSVVNNSSSAVATLLAKQSIISHVLIIIELTIRPSH